MQIFAYEYFTGGGAGQLGDGAAAESLLGEAAAMIRSVTEDFCRLPGVRVVTTRAARLPAFHPEGCRVQEVGSEGVEQELFVGLAQESDWTLVIAPETDGVLLTRARWVEAAGGRLLSPNSAMIEIAASKQSTASALARGGVPVPRGVVLAPGEASGLVDLRFPAVIKPVDGCGSQGVRLVREPEQLGSMDWAGNLRVEEFVPGLAASVSVLCGQRGCHALPACEQRLAGDGSFAYLGGRLPLASNLNQRARQLALRAMRALPAAVGYVGVDLVLGEATDGSGDRVIEINPRLTTSYVGLRALARTNLSGAMLAVARGEEPHLSFGEAPVEFTAAGDVVKCD